MIAVVLIATIAAFIAGIFACDYLARGKRELFDQPSGDDAERATPINQGE